MENLQTKIFKYNNEVRNLKNRYHSVYTEYNQLNTQPNQRDVFEEEEIADIYNSKKSNPFVKSNYKPIVLKVKTEDSYELQKEKTIKTERIGNSMQVGKMPKLAYKIFYESLQQSKKFNKKPRTTVSSLKKPTVIGNKQTIQIQTKEQDNETVNESKNSIKEIVFNDDLLGRFDKHNISDMDFENDRILTELENRRFSSKDIQQPLEEDDFPVDTNRNEGLFNYINLTGFPYYIDPDNVMLLKASSLFENSKLMETREFIVYCKTNYISHNLKQGISIRLTYKPKLDHLYLSSHLLQSSSIIANPQIISNQPFTRSLNQDFTFIFNRDTKIIDFPKLQLTITRINNHRDHYHIPIPFSINKFRANSYNDVDSIFSFINRVN